MRRLVLLPLLVIAAFAVAACGSSGSPAPPTTGATAPGATAAGSPGGAGGGCASGEAGATADVTVEIQDFAFNPAEVTASVGQTIAWVNGDSAPHTATTDDGACDTGNLSQGATGLLVFNEAGTFPYHCNVHPNMTGTITIQ